MNGESIEMMNRGELEKKTFHIRWHIGRGRLPIALEIKETIGTEDIFFRSLSTASYTKFRLVYSV